jgi:hypothetical protein
VVEGDATVRGSVFKGSTCEGYSCSVFKGSVTREHVRGTVLFSEVLAAAGCGGASRVSSRGLECGARVGVVGGGSGSGRGWRAVGSGRVGLRSGRVYMWAGGARGKRYAGKSGVVDWGSLMSGSVGG